MPTDKPSAAALIGMRAVRLEAGQRAAHGGLTLTEAAAIIDRALVSEREAVRELEEAAGLYFVHLDLAPSFEQFTDPGHLAWLRELNCLGTTTRRALARLRELREQAQRTEGSLVRAARGEE